MINYIFISFSAVQLYGLLHIYLYSSPLITNSDGLIAQLVEHCIGIAEVMGLNPVQAWIFFHALISQLLNLCV